ncbi:MAG: carbon-nitrogen hydrolase family protein, partial [Acidobacteriota bacterium]|nr:carbon-nitrogen hydrolase family protein [Acidobacteriota bacterium]
MYLNLKASLAKAIEQIEQAATKGARLIAFGETWLPGYPACLDQCPEAALWNHEPTREVFARLRQNSVIVPSRETEMLSEASGDLD